MEFNLYWFHLLLLLSILRQRLFTKSSSLREVVDFWIVVLQLAYLMIKPIIKVLLACCAQESRQRGFPHSWKANWNQEILVDILRLD